MEVTCRALQGRHLLRPSRKVNRIILGVLGRSQRKYRVEICGFVFLSNHYHLLLIVPDARRLAQFMNYFNGNLARELGRLQRWRERFWSRRYQSIVVSDEPAAQIARLKYVLAHGVKEGLVRDPRAWSGVHSVEALLSQTNVEGTWYDRTGAYNARVRSESLLERAFAYCETVEITRLPCWRDASPETVVLNIRNLLAQILREAPDMLRRRVRSFRPHQRPRRVKRAPAPWFHCASGSARRRLMEAYHLFLEAFRDAATSLQRGDPSAVFPQGSFPPGLPFVEAA